MPLISLSYHMIYDSVAISLSHDDVIKWKHFSRYWPFVRGIHRSPVNSPHKSQWRGALMFSLICVWINGGVNNREAGDLRHYRAHHDVIIMIRPTKPTNLLFTPWFGKQCDREISSTYTILGMWLPVHSGKSWGKSVAAQSKQNNVDSA